MLSRSQMGMGQVQAMMAVSPAYESMEQWQALLDSAGEGIWGLDLEGRCTFVNRMAAGTLGFSSEELIGADMHQIVHRHDDESEQLPVACPVLGAFLGNNIVHRLTDTLFRKDESSFTADISAHPIFVGGRARGVAVTFRDITELRLQQQETLRVYDLAERRTAELDAVIESMPHGVYVATFDAKVRSNRRARAMSGEAFPVELTTLDRALAGESSTETVKSADRWIRSMAAPIILNGKILGGVAVNTDVTQSRLQDEALRKSEKLAAVGQLASSIAHEINNPLESITNLLYLIRQSDSIEDTQDYARLAQEELARVTQITLQTLRFHRQQNRPAETNMAELLNTVMALYTGRLLVRDIIIEVKLEPAPKVTCLEGEIRQVINNLVRNALDAMSSGGSLYIRLHSQPDWRTGRRGVRVTVADTGEGIDRGILPYLFEPFHTTKELTGTGLGLWVSKGIVEKHGGRIIARTRRGTGGHGTVFAVWLPVDGGVSLNPQAD